MPTLRSLLTLAALAAILAGPAAAQTARLQVIHNAADPAAAVVDVYVNGTRLLDNFAFRTATPFIDVPAGVALSVAVAPGTSTGVGDAVFTRSYTLAAGSRTQLIANGVLVPGFFATNPSGRATAFDLLVGGDAREASDGPGSVRVRVVHGATDAPTVDIRTGGAVLVDDASYRDVTGYLDVPPASYPLTVTSADTTVAAFTADLAAAGGGAVTVLASGFLSPGANQNGPAFGLLAVFPSGTTALLPAAGPSARLQVIHNAADPALSVVDVYLNGTRLLNDFAFRTATPFVDVPAGVALTIGVAPGTSTGPGQSVLNITTTLPANATAQLIAQGVLTPAQFAANPNGRPTGVGLLVGTGALETGTAGAVRVRVVHGATDAPTVDVRSGATVLVDDATYRDVTGYLSVPPAVYTLGITTASGAPVAAFTANLSGAGGGAVTVLASGFLTPSANQSGPAFGLLAVFPNGTTALLPAATVSSEPAPAAGVLALGAPAPNPLAAEGRVAFSLAAPGRVSLALYDVLGRQVVVLEDREMPAAVHEARLDTARLAAGTYVLRLQTPDGARSRTVTVVR